MLVLLNLIQNPSLLDVHQDDSLNVVVVKAEVPNNFIKYE